MDSTPSPRPTSTPADRHRRARRGLLTGVLVSTLGLTVACGAVESGTSASPGTTATGTGSSGSGSTSSWSTGSGVSTPTGSSHATSSGS